MICSCWIFPRWTLGVVVRLDWVGGEGWSIEENLPNRLTTSFPIRQFTEEAPGVPISLKGCWSICLVSFPGAVNAAVDVLGRRFAGWRGVCADGCSW